MTWRDIFGCPYVEVVYFDNDYFEASREGRATQKLHKVSFDTFVNPCFLSWLQLPA
jgi:hypothetical protein